MKWIFYLPNFETDSYIFHPAWRGHILWGYDLVSNLKPSVIVELGTYYGCSFFSFCQAVKDHSLKTKLYAIDTWKGDKHGGKYGKEVYNYVSENVVKHYGQIDYNLLKGKFNNYINNFNENSISILHIDGLHTYNAVKEDFQNWFSKVEKDGIIMFHDTRVGIFDFGVKKLWEELKNEYQKFNFIEFEHQYGLGIMFNKQNILSSINLEYFPEIYKNKAALLDQKLINDEINKKNNDVANSIIKQSNINIELRGKLEQVCIENNKLLEENKSRKNEIIQLNQKLQDLKNDLDRKNLILNRKSLKTIRKFLKIKND